MRFKRLKLLSFLDIVKNMPQSMNQNIPVTQIISGRTSRRTYRQEDLPGEVLQTIRDMTGAISQGPLGTPLSFSVVSLGEPSNQKLKLGTYGFIQGARYFIAGQIYPSQTGFLDYGCELEKLILELTAMGLGTCWLGGTFDRGEFAKAIGLKENHVIPAITPVGYAAENRGFGERLIRFGAGSKNRVPPEKLFFDQSPDTPLVLPAENPLQAIFDAVRIGPSASNNQPWRIIATGSRFDFHIARKPGYAKAFSRVDMQMIDMGIAMSHFELAALENGLIPDWKILKAVPGFTGMEYVISVFLPL